jgi:hypothetical protein
MIRAAALVAFVMGVGGWQTGSAPKVDVTGAWSVTITMAGGEATGLAFLSQDGPDVTGMIGPADTDLMPAKGSVSGDRLMLTTQPRKGRTAAFARCDVVVTGERMSGTIDTDKGTIVFVKRRRQ